MFEINGTCNSTLEDLRIGSSEDILVGNFTFHELGEIIAGGTAAIAILLSLYLIWMHALNYTKPYEQRHIIRILFMVPVYATASFLQFRYYWHAVYFQVISECYEAFAIASFFALLCHYLAPNLHEQKHYFRTIQPVAWVLPIGWFKKCCGGERGCWRTPRSGLTWFNIIWAGIYQYCFIRVAMTITAVVTQYFQRYCESSNSPLFGHIWILVIEASAVTVAMYCVIQFYVQLRADLAPHRPFLKVVAIKLVIFLSFWQTFMISILTSSTVGVLHPSSHIAYPDLKRGIPALLLCIEMAFFAIMHLFAFPWKPYGKGSKGTTYPLATSGSSTPEPKQGGFLGLKAFADAMNPWDLVKGFARGMRWLFVGVKHRENDASYKPGGSFDMNDNEQNKIRQNTHHLPIADEFRRSKFGMPLTPTGNKTDADEGAGLIAHAQPNPSNHPSGYIPARQRYDVNGQDISSGGTAYNNQSQSQSHSHSPYNQENQNQSDIGMALSSDPQPYQSHVAQHPQAYIAEKRQQQGHATKPSEQWAKSSVPVGNGNEGGGKPDVHGALWGGSSRDRDRSREGEF